MTYLASAAKMCGRRVFFSNGEEPKLGIHKLVLFEHLEESTQILWFIKFIILPFSIGNLKRCRGAYPHFWANPNGYRWFTMVHL